MHQIHKAAHRMKLMVQAKKRMLWKVLKLLVRFNLQSAYPNLYTMDRILTTLPTCFTKRKIKFSKLKYIKSRLRPTMGRERLIPPPPPQDDQC